MPLRQRPFGEANESSFAATQAPSLSVVVSADVPIFPAPDPWNCCLCLEQILAFFKSYGNEFRSVIKSVIPHGLVENQTSFVAGHGAVIGADRDLQSTHRSDQMNDVMGMIPGRIEQREGARTFKDKVVVHLMTVHVVLL